MKTMGVDEVAAEVEKHYADGCVSGAGRLVEITGGEPLLQPETVTLCERFSALGYEVMVETNGSLDISAFPKGIRRVVDVKCPGSGAGGSFLTDNLNYIRADDEVKFVAASIDDAVWAKEFCDQYGLIGRCAVIFSPASPALPYSALAEWITKNRLTGIRLGVQLHKVVWGDKRGV
jgi:7-carboxy-7-deazaguanine synthase